MIYQQLAMVYGWTPEIVGNLTISQILLYLPDKDGGLRRTDKGSKFKNQMLKRRKLLEEAHIKYKGNVPDEVCQEIFKKTEV